MLKIQHTRNEHPVKENSPDNTTKSPVREAVRALSAPVDNLYSNWAYMVMTALAWNLKAWWALWSE